MTIGIRPARADDAAAIAAIYAPYVTDTVVTFEEEPPAAAEMEARITDVLRTHPWLVAEDDGAVVGYAYAAPFHRRVAYRLTCETTIYLSRDARARGLGRRLYGRLLDALGSRGLAVAIGLITLPNDESALFHEAMGFTPVGRLSRVGWKFGAWHDVGYFQHDLAPRDGTTIGTAG